jgi:hypothetical protein
VNASFVVQLICVVDTGSGPACRARVMALEGLPGEALAVLPATGAQGRTGDAVMQLYGWSINEACARAFADSLPGTLSEWRGLPAVVTSWPTDVSRWEGKPMPLGVLHCPSGQRIRAHGCKT